MNYMDFCFQPRASLATYTFFRAAYRQEGFDKPEYDKYIREEYLTNRTFEMNRDKYRIPLKTHRVWVTSPHNPREMLDSLEEYLLPKMAETNKVLDEAANNDPLNTSGEKWEHIFWVNDRTAIPRSVAYMET